MATKWRKASKPQKSVSLAHHFQTSLFFFSNKAHHQHRGGSGVKEGMMMDKRNER